MDVHPWLRGHRVGTFGQTDLLGNALTSSQIGGSTAAIGDPTGRTSSREPMPTATRRANIYSMQAQLRRLWEKMEKHAVERHGYEREWSWRRNLWNNSEWFNRLTVHEFMSQLGNGTRLGPLLGRDT